MEITFRVLGLKHLPNPKYLSVTLNRSLSFNIHLANVVTKIGFRINIIHKLTGTDWGTDFWTLKTSTIALLASKRWTPDSIKVLYQVRLILPITIGYPFFVTSPLHSIVGKPHYLLKLWTKLSNNFTFLIQEYSKIYT